MTGTTSRRALLAAVGATALAVAFGQATQAAEANVRGTIAFSGGGAIPAGTLKVRLEDPSAASKAQRRIAETELNSRGKDGSIPFSLEMEAARSGTLEVVVRLEREDGWLIARGSEQFKPGEAVTVSLNTVQY